MGSVRAAIARAGGRRGAPPESDEFSLPSFPSADELARQIDEYSNLRTKKGSLAGRILRTLDAHEDRIVSTVIEGVFRTGRAKRAIADIVREHLDPQVGPAPIDLDDVREGRPQARLREALDIHLRSEINAVVQALGGPNTRLERALGLLDSDKANNKAGTRLEKLDPKVLQLAQKIRREAQPTLWKKVTDELISQVERQTAELDQLQSEQRTPSTWGWEEPESSPLAVLSSLATHLEGLDAWSRRAAIRDIPGLREAMAKHEGEPLFVPLVEVLGGTPRFDTQVIGEINDELIARTEAHDRPGQGPTTALDALESLFADIEGQPPSVRDALGSERLTRSRAARDGYAAAFDRATRAIFPPDVVARNDLQVAIHELYANLQTTEVALVPSDLLGGRPSLSALMGSDADRVARAMDPIYNQIEDSYEGFDEISALIDADPDQAAHLPILRNIIEAQRTTADKLEVELTQGLAFKRKLLDLAPMMRADDLETARRNAVEPLNKKDFAALQANPRFDLRTLREPVLGWMVDIRDEVESARLEIADVFGQRDRMPVTEQSERVQVALDKLAVQNEKLAALDTVLDAVPRLREAVASAPESALRRAAGSSAALPSADELLGLRSKSEQLSTHVGEMMRQIAAYGHDEGRVPLWDRVTNGLADAFPSVFGLSEAPLEAVDRAYQTLRDDPTIGAKALFDRYEQKFGTQPKFEVVPDLHRPAAWDPERQVIALKDSQQFTKPAHLQRRIVMEVANAVLDSEYKKVWDDAVAGKLTETQFVEGMERVEFEAVKMHHEVFGRPDGAPRDARDIFGAQLADSWPTPEDFLRDQARARGQGDESKAAHSDFYKAAYARATRKDAHGESSPGDRGYIFHPTVPKAGPSTMALDAPAEAPQVPPEVQARRNVTVKDFYYGRNLDPELTQLRTTLSENGGLDVFRQLGEGRTYRPTTDESLQRPSKRPRPEAWRGLGKLTLGDLEIRDFKQLTGAEVDLERWERHHDNPRPDGKRDRFLARGEVKRLGILSNAFDDLDRLLGRESQASGHGFDSLEVAADTVSGRPGWTDATARGLNVAFGEHRRHILAWHTIRDFANQVLQDPESKKAAVEAVEAHVETVRSRSQTQTEPPAELSRQAWAAQLQTQYQAFRQAPPNPNSPEWVSWSQQMEEFALSDALFYGEKAQSEATDGEDAKPAAQRDKPKTVGEIRTLIANAKTLPENEMLRMGLYLMNSNPQNLWPGDGRTNSLINNIHTNFTKVINGIDSEAARQEAQAKWQTIVDEKRLSPAAQHTAGLALEVMEAVLAENDPTLERLRQRLGDAIKGLDLDVFASSSRDDDAAYTAQHADEIKAQNEWNSGLYDRRSPFTDYMHEVLHKGEPLDPDKVGSTFGSFLSYEPEPRVEAGPFTSERAPRGVNEAFAALYHDPNVEAKALFDQYMQKYGHLPRFEIVPDLPRPAAWDPDRQVIALKEGAGLQDPAKLQRRMVMEVANALVDSEYGQVWNEAVAGKLTEDQFVEQMERVEYKAVQMHHDVFKGPAGDSRDIFGAQLAGPWSTVEGFLADQSRTRGRGDETKAAHSDLYREAYARATQKDEHGQPAPGERGYIFHATVPKDGAPTGGSEPRPVSGDSGKPRTDSSSSSGRPRVGASDGPAGFLSQQDELDEENEVGVQVGGSAAFEESLGPIDISGEATGSATVEAGYSTTKDRTSGGAQAQVDGSVEVTVGAGPVSQTVGADAEAYAGVRGGVDHHFDGNDATVGADFYGGVHVNGDVSSRTELGDVAHVETTASVGAGASAEGTGKFIMRDGIPGVTVSGGFDAGISAGVSQTVGVGPAELTGDAGVILGVSAGAGASVGMQEDGKFHIEFNVRLALGVGIDLGLDLAIDVEKMKEIVGKLDPRDWGPKLAEFAGGVLRDAGLIADKALDFLDDNLVGPLKDGFAALGDGFMGAIRGIGNFFENIGEEVEEFFVEDVPEFFTEDVPEFFTEDVPEFFTEDVPEFFEDVAEVGKDVANTVVDGAKKGVNAVGKVAKKIFKGW